MLTYFQMMRANRNFAEIRVKEILSKAVLDGGGEKSGASDLKVDSPNLLDKPERHAAQKLCPSRRIQHLALRLPKHSERHGEQFRVELLYPLTVMQNNAAGKPACQ